MSPSVSGPFHGTGKPFPTGEAARVHRPLIAARILAEALRIRQLDRRTAAHAGACPVVFYWAIGGL